MVHYFITAVERTKRVMGCVGQSIRDIVALRAVFCITALPLPNRPRLWCRVSGLVYNTVTARFNAPNSIENISHIDNNKEFASNGLICLSPDILIS